MDRSQRQRRRRHPIREERGSGHRQGSRLAPLSRQTNVGSADGQRTRFFCRRRFERLPRPNRRTGFSRRRSSALSHLHQRHHRQAQGLSTSHRRLSRLRRWHFKVLPGPSTRRCVLVHGRHRLDYRPFIHRLRPARSRRHQRPLRRRSAIPRRRSSMAHRRTSRRQHLPHLSNRHSNAPKSWRRRTQEIQLLLQAHDHRRRTHRARSLALVLRSRWQRQSRHRRHLVANRNRRFPLHHQARARPHEARLRRPRRARNLSRHLGRKRKRDQSRRTRRRKYLHSKSLARHNANHLGRSRSLRKAVLRKILQESEKQKMAGLALFRRRWRHALRRRLLPHPRPRRRRHQRRRPPPRHQRDRIRLSQRSRNRRSRRRSRRRRNQRPRPRSLHLHQTRHDSQ